MITSLRNCSPQDAVQGLTDEDAVPDLPQAPVSAPGDLWILGSHRVLCGDATAPANAGANTVSILLGNGNGSFQSALTVAASVNPTSVAAADFNRDGRLDMVVANATPIPGTVSLLLGFGNGYFQLPRAFSVEMNPSFVVVSDFNLDGKPDLAVANAASGTISVLMGLGDGLFATPLTFDVGGAPVWMVATDVNADGKPDLVVANRSSGTVSVLLNNTPKPFQDIIN